MEGTANKKIKVGAVNSWAEPLAIEKNIDGIASMLNALSNEGVDYILFPELSVSGYINNTKDLKIYARKHNEVLNQLKNLSTRFLVAFSVGLPMPIAKDWGIAQLTFYGGKIINIHFKTHLSIHEQQVFKVGEKIDTFKLKSFSVGMQICLESHFPELSLSYQQQGGNLLCFAFASPRETAQEKHERFRMMLQTRAYDNACFVMACNLTGKTPSGKHYAGVSMIISPRGKVLSSCIGMQATYCISDIDLSEIETIKNSQMSNFPAYRQMKTNVEFKNA